MHKFLKDIIIYVFVIFMIVAALKLIDMLDESAIQTSEYYTIVDNYNEISVFFSTSIGPADAYAGLIRKLMLLPDRSNIKLYLSGNGGYISGIQAIKGAIDYKKHYVESIVYGNVYSAHAAMALFADKVTIANKHTLFMFHRPAIYDSTTGNTVLPSKYCEKFKGFTDRGINAVFKCFMMDIYSNRSYNKTIMSKSLKILTKEELKAYQQGGDIIITGKDIAERLKKLEAK